MSKHDKTIQKTTWDFIHTTVKAWLSAIPIVWWPAVELFSAIIGAPLEKRRDDWIGKIAHDLEELSEQVDELIPHLQESEEFISILLNATQIALKTHHEEKIEALRNMVIWFAKNPSTDDDTILTFMQLIDKLSPSHLRTLKFINNPSGYMTEKWLTIRWFGSIWEAMRYAIPEIAINRAFQEKIIIDLDNENLTNSVSRSLNTMMTSAGTLTSRTTEMWKEFLRYIQNHR